MSVIIGAKKAGKKLPLMSGGEITQLIEGSDRLLEQGIPLEVPAAVRVADLVRISSTMKRHRELLVEFVELYNTITAAYAAQGEANRIAAGGLEVDLFALKESIEEVLTIEPPPLVEPSPLLEM